MTVCYHPPPFPRVCEALHDPRPGFHTGRPPVLRTRRQPARRLDHSNQEGVVWPSSHRHPPAGPGRAASGEPRAEHRKALPEGAALESSRGDAPGSSNADAGGGASHGCDQVSVGCAFFNKLGFVVCVCLHITSSLVPVLKVRSLLG